MLSSGQKTFEVLIPNVVGKPSAYYSSPSVGHEGFSLLVLSELLMICYIQLTFLIHRKHVAFNGIEYYRFRAGRNKNITEILSEHNSLLPT